MKELLRTIRVVGLRPLIRLARARRVGWDGIISGFYTTRCMQALFNVGFFDEAQRAGSVDLQAFAGARKLDADILKSVCDSMYAIGILTKQGSKYGLDAKGTLLVEEARGWFDGVYGYEDLMHFLEDLLTREKTYPKDVYKRPFHIAQGSAAIERLIYYPLAIDRIKRRGYRNVLDLGCGNGAFLRHLCQSDQGITGYGVDIAPEAIADGNRLNERDGLKDRIHLFTSDIATAERIVEPLRTVDAATTFFVLHELLYRGDQAVVDLLRGFRRMFPGVPLIVFEAIRPTPEEMRKKPGMAVQYYLHHDLSHQKPVGRKVWMNLFEAAGCTSIEESYLGFARTSIFTVS